jgi:hypothetical protein
VFPSRCVTPYIVAQLAGAIVAAYALLLAYGGPVNHLGATLVDTQRVTYGGAFMFEAVGTLFLVGTVLHTAVRSPSRLAPAAIGMTVTLCILGFGVMTGGSINPARTIGPAVAAGLYEEVPLYVAAQLVGAIFAAALYRWFWVQRAARCGCGTGRVSPGPSEPWMWAERSRQRRAAHIHAAFMPVDAAPSRELSSTSAAALCFLLL